MDKLTFSFKKTLAQLLEEIAAGAYLGETLTVTGDFRIEVISPDLVEIWICEEVMEINPREAIKESGLPTQEEKQDD